MSTTRRRFVRNAIAATSLTALPLHGEGGPGAAEQAKPSLARDPLRPQYHLLPAKNWMNDPNGPIYWKGKYHMFFQYNPNDAVWGDMHWDHAVSEDMVHWKHLPVALAPTPGGPDQEGVYSGTAFVLDGRVGMMYTGVKLSSLRDATIKSTSWRETQCIAFANDDDLLSFTKVPQPVIPAPPRDLPVNGFRDPAPWKQGDWWYTPIASGLPGVGGAILLYRSRDLRSWEYVKIFAQRGPSFEAYPPWDVWECPEFFPLGDRHVLIFSTVGKAFWQSGRFNPATLDFQPDRMGILDYGSFYAPKTQLDAHGNRILWGWIQEARSAEAHRAAGWAGMMSLPRVLSLAPDGTLRSKVADAVTTLRRDEQHIAGSQYRPITIQGCCGEAVFRTVSNPGPFELHIQGERDGKTLLAVSFETALPHRIFIDERPLTISPASGGGFDLHLYFDGSVIELIVNGEIAWTKRFYYEGGTQGALLRWTEKNALDSATWWRIEPISAHRLTD